MRNTLCITGIVLYAASLCALMKTSGETMSQNLSIHVICVIVLGILGRR